MIKVEQSAKTIDEGIKNLMAGAKQDYYRMSNSGDHQRTDWIFKRTIRQLG